MDTTRLPSSTPRTNRQMSRRWCVPPAIMLDPDETLEGSLIFDEFRGRELGLLLWSALRDVTLWANVKEENRPGLFSAATAEKRLQALVQETSLDTAEQLLLTTLTTVTATPDAVDREIVSLVCTELSKWAESRGASATAIAFAQAAPVADDADALASRRVGMLAYAGRHQTFAVNGPGQKIPIRISRCSGRSPEAPDETGRAPRDVRARVADRIVETIETSLCS